MKMLSFLPGELSNSATYFTTFATGNQSGVNDHKKTFGISPKYILKPFAHFKRVEDTTKEKAEIKLMEKEKNAGSQLNIKNCRHILVKNSKVDDFIFL